MSKSFARDHYCTFFSAAKYTGTARATTKITAWAKQRVDCAPWYKWYEC